MKLVLTEMIIYNVVGSVKWMFYETSPDCNDYII